MVDTETFEEIVESVVFDERKECELPDHGTLKRYHDDGPGVWLSTLICPNSCGLSLQYVICQKQKEAIEEIDVPAEMYTCTRCGYDRGRFGNGFTHVWVGG